MKDLTVYQEAIDYALDDKDIKNIAITGIYGSGKSSVIESYKNKSKKKHKFIHISLAYFQGVVNEEEGKIEDSKKTSTIKVIEGKILNQLLHQIKPTNIPQTIFKVKNNISKRKIWIGSIVASLVILLSSYLFMFDKWKKFIIEQDSRNSFFSWLMDISLLTSTRIFVFLIIFFFIVLLIYKLAYLQLSKKIFKTISIKSKNIESNIEIFNETRDSYFDKYLDDVIYLFDRSDADVIVFEDIDRYNSNIIFSKLKEINTLVNNRKITQNKTFVNKLCFLLNKVKFINSIPIIKHKASYKKLSFLYLLKDDMFISKDRTKFFDFIIPVLPVINASNSYEKLKELLESEGIFSEFTKKFLQDLSLYIDDMRLLKNIYNEFLVYERRLRNSFTQTETKDIEKFPKYDNLLAMIVYKNVLPSDFANLQLNKGLVYQVFSEKTTYLRREKSQIDDKIIQLRQRIEKANQEKLQTEDELCALFLKMPEGYYDFKVNGKSESDFANRLEYVAALKNGKISAMRLGYRYNNVSLEDNFLAINNNPEYVRRKKALEDRSNIEKLQNEIKTLEQEKNMVLNKKLSSIITREDINRITKSLNENTQNDYYKLLAFLLLNGYIDEGYEDYLTYFYQNSLKLKDKNYLRSITDEKCLEWEYKLSNVSEVYDRLSAESFLKVEILNFDLFSYILSKENLEEADLEERTNKLKYLFNTIIRENKIDFLVKIFATMDEALEIKLLVEWRKYAPESFVKILRSSLFTNSEKSNILIKLIDNFSVEELLELDSSKKEILEFIKNKSEFLINVISPSDNFLEKLNSLKIRFKIVVFSKLDKSLSSYIYENGLYVISMGNIKEALLLFSKERNMQEFEHKNYTLIKESVSDPIIKYIDNNIEEYLNEYLEFCSERTNDSIEYIYELLNNDRVLIETRKRYLSTISGNNLAFDRINEKELWEDALVCDLIYPDELNIFGYYIFNNSSWNKTLVEFVNKHKVDLSFNNSKILKIYSDEIQSSFFIATIRELSLNNNVYKKILSEMKSYYKSGFTIESIPLEKILILIDIEVIKFSRTSLIDLRKLYPDSVIYFISRNINSYLKIDNDSELYNASELIKVLEHNLNIPFTIQRKIVDLIEEPISIYGKESYKTNLRNHILQTKFYERDLEMICSDYEHYSSSTKEIIINVAVQYIDKVIEEHIDLSKELLIKLLKNLEISIESRQLLFSRNTNKFSTKELKNEFTQLGLNSYIKLVNNYKNRMNLNVNEINKNLLTYLDQKNLISSFNKNDSIYKANGNSKINQI